MANERGLGRGLGALLGDAALQSQEGGSLSLPISQVEPSLKQPRKRFEEDSLQDLADRVYLSRSYLSSLFKKETGDSITNYINRVRVEKSKALLVGSTVSLAEVAHLCGFEDQSYFTRVFKAKEGVSPKKFRDKRGNLSKDE